jgi:hypothetical protein
MKITLSELRLRIDDLKKEYSNKLYTLQGGATVSKVKELNGKEEVMSAPFDFKTELEALDKTSKEVARLSAVLAKANSNTEIDEADTLQTAITKTVERRKLLDKVEYILSGSKERKVRKSDGGLGTNNAYYDVVELNFDKAELTEFRDKIKSELNALEVKIQEANNSTKVEV